MGGTIESLSRAVLYLGVFGAGTYELTASGCRPSSATRCRYVQNS